MQNPNNQPTKARISKRLTRNDVEQCLSFSVPRILNVEVGNLFYLYVRDSTGEAYTFPCSIQQKEDMGLVVSINWHGFVRVKEIRPDDEVFLLGEFMGGEDTRMQFSIELQRKIRLFGRDIWG